MSESHPHGDAFEDAGSDTGENQFLQLLNKDAHEPSEEVERDEYEDDDTSTEDEADEDAEELSDEDDAEAEDTDEVDHDDEDEAPTKKRDLSDETEIEHTVNGEKKTFTVAQLKRLAGQEAALTQRSMELAETKKRADESVTTYAASLNYLYERAKQKADQYSDQNLLLWSRDMSQDQLAALVEEAKVAKQDRDYFEREIATVSNRLQAEAAQRLRQDAQVAHNILSGPVDQGGIEGWSQSRYEDLMGFAISQGMPKATVHNLTDPAAWRLIDLAFRQARGTKALATKTAPAKPKAPGRVVKSTPAAAIQAAKPTRDKTAMRTLRETGDVDAAANVFMTRMSRK
uniref:hypothetical protein n=1 Tax=Methylobacterium sp. B34 TaxID=95563 RepID=UPI0003491D08|nr:hypothetical protein [Methylobacterium sp. B34]